jgi:hypothetical protein
MKWDILEIKKALAMGGCKGLGEIFLGEKIYENGRD